MMATKILTKSFCSWLSRFASGRVSFRPATEAPTKRPTIRTPSQSVGIWYSQRKFISGPPKKENRSSACFSHLPLRLVKSRLEDLDLLVLQRLPPEALAQVEVDDPARGLGGGGITDLGLAAHGERRHGIGQGAPRAAEAAPQPAVGRGGGERRLQPQVEHPYGGGDQREPQRQGQGNVGQAPAAAGLGAGGTERVETGRGGMGDRLLVTLEVGPEVGPQLAQAAEDAELIVEAEGEDVAVPAEHQEVPRLLGQGHGPFVAAG